MMAQARVELLDQLEQQFMTVVKGMVSQRVEGDGVCLTPALDHVLAIIGLHGACNVKQIAQILQITSGAAAQHITSLEADGLCRRRTNPEDHRETLVELTEPGQIVVKKLRAKHCRLLEAVFSNLDDTELSTLVQLTSKASRKYNEETQIV